MTQRMGKLAVIGGSSPNTPGLFACLKRRQLQADEVALIGKDSGRTATIAAFSRRLCDELSYHTQITAHTDLAAGVRGAQFVLNQARIGGWKRWSQCNYAAECFQLGAHLEFTMAALTNLNEILNIARVVLEVAPQAFFIELTNPAGLHCEAFARYQPELKFISGCPSPLRYRGALCRLLGHKDVGSQCAGLEMRWFGFNHLAWIQKVTWEGQDVTEEIALAGSKEERPLWDLSLYERLGLLPLMLANRVLDEPRPLLRDAESRAQAYSLHPRRQKEREERYRLLQNESITPTCALAQPGRKDWYELVLGPIIEGIVGSQPQRYYCSMPAGEAMPCFPGETVECGVTIAANSASLQKKGPIIPCFLANVLPPPLEKLCRALRQSEQFLLEAIVTGSRDRLRESILVNPLCGDREKAERFTNFIVSELDLEIA